jgi:thymidylate kinase
MNKIIRVLITGSVQAGKDTTIKRLKNDLEQSGYYVVNTNEVAELILLNNIKPFGDDTITLLEYQDAVFQGQLFVEDLYMSLIKNIKTDKTIVFLLNRGVLDGQPFIGESEFNEIITKHNFDVNTTKDRYDIVLCLETYAMLGVYDKRANSEVRFQDFQKAVEMNNQFYDMYKKYYPNIKYIKANEAFEEKYMEALKTLKIELNKLK